PACPRRRPSAAPASHPVRIVWPRTWPSASSSVGKIAKVPSIPDSSKIFSTLAFVHTTAMRAPTLRLRLTPTSTLSAVESMKRTSVRSTTSCVLPASIESTSAHFREGARSRSSSPSSATTLVRSSGSLWMIPNAPVKPSVPLVSVLPSMSLLALDGPHRKLRTRPGSALTTKRADQTSVHFSRREPRNLRTSPKRPRRCETGVVADELPELIVGDAVAWRAWLAEHHAARPGVWLVLAKKGTTAPTSLSYEQALEEALCHGWIDGQVRRRDEATFRQRFTPRRVRSAWSKRNVGIAERLIASQRMHPAGLRAIEAAKGDGRWQAAYAGPATIALPADLEAALAAEPRARAMFEILTSQNRYSVLLRIDSAKRSDTRARRIERFVAMLARGETIHPQKRKLTS